jgi:DNA-binding transcriptional ArsR family regulator
METRRDVFQAIADPTRRQIIGLISTTPLNVNAIADHFKVTRQAISLHVKILEECGLVVIKQQGRERLCEGRLQKLGEVASWVNEYRNFWVDRFDSLDQYLAKNKKHAKRKNSK